MKTKKTQTVTRKQIPSFDVSAEESNQILAIAKRAVALADKYGVDYKLLEAEMDITACHANGNPLNLADLLHTDDGNFGHDVFGIRQHINRTTGELENCFSPRFSRPSKGGR